MPIARAAFLLYSMLVTAAIVYLIWYVAPVHGNTSIFVYLGICSLIGSLSVMSVKARARRAQLKRSALCCKQGAVYDAWVLHSGRACTSRFHWHQARPLLCIFKKN